MKVNMSPVILLVDDDAESANLLGLTLGMFWPQAVVHFADGGQEALEMAQQQRPDVAVVTLEMPELDGVELAIALRASFPEATPRLIALSGNVSQLAAARDSRAFDHHMSKPFDVHELVRILTTAPRS